MIEKHPEDNGRPAILQKKESSLGKETLLGRRPFLKWLWVVLWGVITGELFWLVYYMVKPKGSKRSGSESKILSIGPASAYKVGSVTAVPLGKLYLVRTTQGGFLAIARECTHLGCTVYWDGEEQRFHCPCHGSSFTLSGNVIQSPAPRPLDIYEIFIENGIVKVDLEKRSRRTEVDKSQVVYL